MPTIVALGEMLIDFAPVAADAAGYPTLKAQPGGAPCNFLAALQKYGCSTAMIGKVGDDRFGRLLIQTAADCGIETRGIIKDAAAFTTMAFVTLDAEGHREFSFARKPGADTCLTEHEVDYSLIDDCRVFHFGTLSLTDEPARTATQRAVAYAKAQGKLISFDPNLRKLLWPDGAAAATQMEWGLHQADIVKISDEEVDFLWHTTPAAAAQKLLREYGGPEYDFRIRETQTYELIEDVALLRSEVGVLYLNKDNETVLRKVIREHDLQFTPLFTAKPHVFVSASSPLAAKPAVTLDDLAPYPRLSYEQGEHNAFYFSEEILSTRDSKKDILVSDRATLFNLLIGLNGYTICSGVISESLNGPNIVAVPLLVDDAMQIGYLTHKQVQPGLFGKRYIEILQKHTAQ